MSPPEDAGNVSPSPRFKILGGCPPEIVVFKENFGIFAKIFVFSKIKWANPRRNKNLGVGGFDSPESIPGQDSSPPSQKSMVMPLLITYPDRNYHVELSEF